MASGFRATVPVRRSGEVPALPYSVKLAGSPRSLRWPGVCVCCGTTASEWVPVTTAFDRDWRRQHGTRSAHDFRIVAVRTISVPACVPCATRPRLEARPVGPFATILSVVATAWAIPFVVALLGLLRYFVPGLLGGGAALVAPTRTAWQAAAFAVAAVAFAAAAWYQTRSRRVTPPTAVTRAFDFSDNLAGFLGAEHRVYGMENESFAQAFESANVDRLWVEARRPGGRGAAR